MLRNVDDWDGEHFAFRLDGVPQDAAKTVVSAHDGPAGPSVTIPDAHFLLHADFKRAGSDLILTGDHKTTVVRDYFATDQRATLFAGNGMSLSPEVIEALAGPMAPGQYAQAGGAQQGAQAVGRVAKVEGSVTVVRNGVAITVNVGDAILKGDVLQTGNGQLGVTFNDGSTFSLTENARLVVNEFIYDPKGNANSQILNLVQGSLTFISGEVAHSGDMKIGTPVATMGIRGTVGGVNDASTDQVSFFIVQSDRGAVLTDSNGTVIAQVVQNGPLVVLRPAGPLQVIAEEQQKTPEQVAFELAALQHIVSVQAVGQQIIQQFFNPNQDQNQNNPQSQGSDHTQIQIDIPKSGIFGENSNAGSNGGVTGDNTATVTITTNNNSGNPPNTPDEPQQQIITVEIPPNLPPVNFGPLNATINEDNTLTLTGANAVSVFDNDTTTLTVTLAATNGTLSLGGIAGLVFTNGDGQDDVTMTFTGLQAAINAALNGSTFTPTQDYNGPASIVITTTDGNQTSSATIDITIDPVNDAPVIATPATNPSTDEDTAVQISGISVGDVDNAALTVTLTAGSTLTLAQTDNLTFVQGDGTDDSTMTFSGTVAAINAALDGLTFAPTPDATSGHIDVTVSDGSANVTETVTVDVAPVNDAPVITPGGDVSGGVVEDTTLSVSGDLDATDADSGAVLAWTLQGGAPGEVATDIIGNVDYTFTIDQLDVVKNGTTIFSDDFGDGNPPPSGVLFANGNPGTYATSGGFTETGGRAVMDDAQAGPTQSALFTSIPFLGHFATLLTNASNSPGDLNSGLKIDDDFTVEGRFDLTSPDESGEGYGIRLTDRGGPDAQAGDDVMELRVLLNANGDLQVSFRERDFVAGEVNNIESILLDPTGADQIVLRLGHQAANPGVVTASFDLLNGGTVIDTVTFSNSGQIFGTETPGDIADDELWTRAQFFSFSPGEVTSSSLVGNYGTLSINQNGEWSYQLDSGSQQVQALAAGQQVTDTFTAVVADETGATDTQDITVTVTGINDAAEITAVPADLVTADFEGVGTDGQAIPTGYLGFNWSAGAGFSLFLLSESSAPAGFPGYANGSVGGGEWIAYTPAGISPVVVEKTGGGEFAFDSVYLTSSKDPGSATITGYLDGVAIGSVTHAIDSATPTLFQASWGAVDRVEIAYTGAVQLVMDNFMLGLEPGDSTGASLFETNAGLTTTGTLTVTDVDVTDQVSVAVSGVTHTGPDGGLTDGDLLSYFSVTPGNIVDGNETSGKLTWTFDSGSQTFDFLAAGQVLELQYVLTPDDGHAPTGNGDAIVTIQIHGTEDAYVEDQFNSQSYSLNTGNINWATDWIETNDTGAPNVAGAGNSPTDGDLLITNDPSAGGNPVLKLSDLDAETGDPDMVQRTVNLAGATAAVLSFDYRRDIPNGSSDDIFPVLISLDGTNFVQIGQIGATGSGSFVDGSYQHFSADISDYISANTTIRFSVGDDVDDGDVVYVDNVKISYVPEVTLTVVTPNGYDMHFLYGDIANSDINVGTITATQFDAVNAGSGHTFRVTGTGFTYDVNGDLTGGTVNSIDIRNTATSATLVTMTGFAINAVALASAVDAFANNGNPVPLSTIFNGHSYLATGGDGNDVIPSFIKADSFDGGGGLNSVDYVHYGQGITVNLADPSQNTGNAAGDSYTNINTIIGTNYNDTLIGDGNINALEGGAGGDSLTGGGGPLDYASYIHAPSAVTANLADPNQNTGHAAGDSYSGINGLLGSNFNDTLVGDGNDNFLRGRGGGDALDGAGGSDTADYLRRGAVTADLTDPNNNTGDAAGDTYTSIENLRGSNFADTLRGDAGNNVITGMGGNDTMTGEADADTFVFHAGDGNDHITDFSLDDFLQFDQSVFADAQAVIDASSSGGPGVTIITAGADTITLDSIDHSVFQTIDHGHILVV